MRISSCVSELNEVVENFLRDGCLPAFPHFECHVSQSDMPWHPAMQVITESLEANIRGGVAIIGLKFSIAYSLFFKPMRQGKRNTGRQQAASMQLSRLRSLSEILTL